MGTTEFDVVLETAVTEFDVTVEVPTSPFEVTVEVGFVGPPGPQGIQGIPGPKGDPTPSYVHDQAVSNTVWNIVHNMSKYPSVICIDSSGDEIEGDVDWTDTNTVTVTFAFPTGGKAYLN